jgi:hypothetical protein
MRARGENRAPEHWLTYEQIIGIALERLGATSARRAGDAPMTAFEDRIVPHSREFLATVHPSLAGPWALAQAERGGAGWCAAEIFRARGEQILATQGPDAWDEAERFFSRSLDLAERQGALAWTLRCAASLARLRVAQGRPEAARDLLGPTLARFREDLAAPDLTTARAVLIEAGA